jgi:hypothetical protein
MSVADHGSIGAGSTSRAAPPVGSVTCGWLTEVLRNAGRLRAGRVSSVRVSRLRRGSVGPIERLSVTYEDPLPGSPSRLIAKTLGEGHLAEERREPVRRREAHVHRDTISALGVLTPSCVFVEVEPRTGPYLLLEGIEALRCGPVIGATALRARRVVEQAALLHAGSWELPEVTGADWFHDGIADWERRADRLDEEATTPGGRWEPDGRAAPGLAAERLAGATIRNWLERARTPRCLSHGDLRLGNLMFDPRGGDRPAVLLDWQTVSASPGIADISVFLGTSVPVTVRREAEADLVRHYHRQLVALGVGSYSWRECWEEYRLHSAAAFLLALDAVRDGVRDLRSMTMLTRAALQVLDHRADELLAG